MIDLGNRLIDEDGTVLLRQLAAVEVLYSGRSIDDALFDAADEDAKYYNDSIRLLDLDMPRLRTSRATGETKDWYMHWNTPEPYASIDVLEFCCSRCDNDLYLERACEEYKLFEARNMIPVLRHLIYMVDDLRERNIVWGVGRGSSVSSLILYLIGINRIDPLKFGLDVGEFLK
jgi:DNA polymerase III alpha subunit